MEKNKWLNYLNKGLIFLFLALAIWNFYTADYLLAMTEFLVVEYMCLLELKDKTTREIFAICEDYQKLLETVLAKAKSKGRRAKMVEDN